MPENARTSIYTYIYTNLILLKSIIHNADLLGDFLTHPLVVWCLLTHIIMELHSYK